MKLWRELDKHDNSLQKGDSWLGTSDIRLRRVILEELTEKVRKPLVEALVFIRDNAKPGGVIQAVARDALDALAQVEKEKP